MLNLYAALNKTDYTFYACSHSLESTHIQADRVLLRVKHLVSFPVINSYGLEHSVFQANIEQLEDGYQGDIIGEATPDIIVSEFVCFQLLFLSIPRLLICDSAVVLALRLLPISSGTLVS